MSYKIKYKIISVIYSICEFDNYNYHLDINALIAVESFSNLFNLKKPKTNTKLVLGFLNSLLILINI